MPSAGASPFPPPDGSLGGIGPQERSPRFTWAQEVRSAKRPSPAIPACVRGDLEGGSPGNSGPSRGEAEPSGEAVLNGRPRGEKRASGWSCGVSGREKRGREAPGGEGLSSDSRAVESARETE